MLDLELTTHCNLSCAWCFVRAVRPNQHMKLDLALALMKEARNTGFEQLHLTGGEPFVYPFLDHILDAAEALRFRHVIINTNGTLLTPARAEALARRNLPISLTISCDGPADHHERNRGTGTYRPTIAGIQAALDADLPTTIFSIASRSIMPELFSFIVSMFKRFPRIAGLTLIPLGDITSGSRTNDDSAIHEDVLTPSQVVDLGVLSGAFLLTGRRVTVLDYPLVNLVYRKASLPVSLVGSHCTACRNRLSVQADGTITPCHPVWTPLATYEPGILRPLLMGKQCQAIATRDFEGCRTCPDRDICGHCRAVVLAATGDILGNDWACRPLRAAMDQRDIKHEMERRITAIEAAFSQPAFDQAQEERHVAL